MKQPTKDALRDQLALAASEIIREREQADFWQSMWASEVLAGDEATRAPKRRWWQWTLRDDVCGPDGAVPAIDRSPMRWWRS